MEGVLLIPCVGFGLTVGYIGLHRDIGIYWDNGKCHVGLQALDAFGSRASGQATTYPGRRSPSLPGRSSNWTTSLKSLFKDGW